jgi:hypothetical protein
VHELRLACEADDSRSVAEILDGLDGSITGKRATDCLDPQKAEEHSAQRMATIDRAHPMRVVEVCAKCEHDTSLSAIKGPDKRSHLVVPSRVLVVVPRMFSITRMMRVS